MSRLVIRYGRWILLRRVEVKGCGLRISRWILVGRCGRVHGCVR